MPGSEPHLRARAYAKLCFGVGVKKLPRHSLHQLRSLRTSHARVLLELESSRSETTINHFSRSLEPFASYSCVTDCIAFSWCPGADVQGAIMSFVRKKPLTIGYLLDFYTRHEILAKVGGHLSRQQILPNSLAASNPRYKAILCLLRTVRKSCPIKSLSLNQQRTSCSPRTRVHERMSPCSPASPYNLTC